MFFTRNSALARPRLTRNSEAVIAASLHAPSPRRTRFALDPNDRSRFESGVEPLDRYFWTHAGQDGVFAELPASTVRKLPRYPLIPATLLGRLAVDRRQHGRDYGRFLLADALCRASRSEIASFAVIVDAKDDSARRFYERESFLPLPDQPMKLFRPMSDIRRLFE